MSEFKANGHQLRTGVANVVMAFVVFHIDWFEKALRPSRLDRRHVHLQQQDEASLTAFSTASRVSPVRF